MPWFTPSRTSWRARPRAACRARWSDEGRGDACWIALKVVGARSFGAAEERAERCRRPSGVVGERESPGSKPRRRRRPQPRRRGDLEQTASRDSSVASRTRGSWRRVTRVVHAQAGRSSADSPRRRRSRQDQRAAPERARHRLAVGGRVRAAAAQARRERGLTIEYTSSAPDAGSTYRWSSRVPPATRAGCCTVVILWVGAFTLVLPKNPSRARRRTHAIEVPLQRAVGLDAIALAAERPTAQLVSRGSGAKPR